MPDQDAPLWKRPASPEDIARTNHGTAAEWLGIEFTEIGERHVVARMPVDHRTRQPMGILHGGASVLLAETVGSVAANLCLPEGQAAVGLDINANHVRSAREGWVTARCTPVHLGRSTQVWSIDITDGQGRLVCQSRLTMAVLAAQA